MKLSWIKASRAGRGWTALAAAFILLAAGPALAADTLAVITTVAPDYSSGAHAAISVEPAGGPRTVRADLVPSATSDLAISAQGEFFFRLARFGADNVTKFAAAAPDQPIWQYSVLGDDQNSNPYAVVAAGPDKAYVLRYGSTKAWIVNPNAASEDQFKIGELDLAGYDLTDVLPEMTAGVVVDGKLFIIMQRLDTGNNWVASQSGYVAVFDVATDTEIDTGLGAADGLKGIPLPGNNPNTIQYRAQDGMIYITATGQLPSGFSDPTGFEYSGGVIQLDPATYAATLVLDDGDEATHAFGAIMDFALNAVGKAYVLGYDGWGDSTLHGVDLTTGADLGAVAGLTHLNLGGMEGGIGLDSNQRLWVADQTNAQVTVINTADDAVEENLPTNLSPTNVTFCSTPDQEIVTGQ